MSAGPAQRQRRVAAAVEEQQRLLAPLDRSLDLRSEPWRDEAAARGLLAAQIDRLDMGHVRTPEPRRQHHALIAALARIDFGLDRRRCGGQDDRDLREMRAHHRHVARVVMCPVVLLVGLIVLFIDHDQAETGIGHEQRGARADDDRRFAG